MYSSVTDLLFDLVKIDSPSGYESEIASFVADYLRKLGVQSEVDESNNLYCRIGQDDDPLLICNHLDTVEPGRGVVPYVDDLGVIRSQGDTILGGDNKVALAAVLFALQSADLSTINLELLFTSREETDSGIKDFDTTKLQAKRALVIDGGGGELSWLASQAPTIIDFSIDVQGKAAHSSRPDLGSSVLPLLSELILDFKPGRIDDDTTYNIGIVNAGDAVNTIPANLHIEGDIRSTNHETAAAFQKQLADHIQQLAKTHNLTVKTNWDEYCRAYKVDTDTEFFRYVADLYVQQGISLKPVNTTSASDAAHLRSTGIEALCLGDGVDSPHEVSESISVEKLEALVGIYNQFLSSSKGGQ